MIGAGMIVPNDVLRFEALLYVSLLLDALTAAIFGIATDNASTPASPSVNLFGAVLLVVFVQLVWLAAQRRKNWAVWTLLAANVLTIVLYIGSFNGSEIGFKTILEMLSIAATAAGFYFAFTPDARRWFTSSSP
jgi:hypothetical protein